jgi:hypothetical protein
MSLRDAGLETGPYSVHLPLRQRPILRGPTEICLGCKNTKLRLLERREAELRNSGDGHQPPIDGEVPPQCIDRLGPLPHHAFRTHRALGALARPGPACQDGKGAPFAWFGLTERCGNRPSVRRLQPRQIENGPRA